MYLINTGEDPSETFPSLTTFFFSFLIIDIGHFPGPQLHPLQKCIHISRTVMNILIWPASRGWYAVHAQQMPSASFELYQETKRQ